MSKICILAIDALDLNQLKKYGKFCKNFSQLSSNYSILELHSVSPPDSNTAWSSIYTGWNPARHGIFHFVDPLDKISLTAGGDIDNAPLRGNTFWDRLSQNGKKVTVLFPHLGYPVWNVKGIMIGRSSFNPNLPISYSPNNIQKDFDCTHLNVMPGFSGGEKNFNPYINHAKKLLVDELNMSLELFKETEWDLFMIYSSILDTIQHNFWNYSDETDPSFAGKNNPYFNVIPTFYKYYDYFVGEFLKLIDDDTTVMIFSDHGHGMRPIKLLNINQLLSQKGFLQTKGKTEPPFLQRVLNIIKKTAIEIITKYELSKEAMKIVKVFPIVKTIYTTPRNIDWNKTKAYMIDMSGIKAYSYGGIRLNSRIVSNDRSETIKQEIISNLISIIDPNTNQRVFKWIVKREDIFHGKYLNKIPELVYQLDESIGGGIQTNGRIFDFSLSHNIVPGSHKLYSGVFIIKNNKQKIHCEIMSILDIAPTILEILGIPDKREMYDGFSIFQDCKKRYLL